MQNEINELRNQVRTLKRMLLGVSGFLVAGGLRAIFFDGKPVLAAARCVHVVPARRALGPADELEVVANVFANAAVLGGVGAATKAA